MESQGSPTNPSLTGDRVKEALLLSCNLQVASPVLTQSQFWI
jgi:hypothetical protein